MRVEALKSASQFFRGPAWWVAWPVRAVFTVVGAIQEAKGWEIGSIWMWLFFGSLSLVAAAFFTYHRQRMKAEAKKQSLPRRIDDLHREGMKLHDALAVPYEPVRRDGIVEIVGNPPQEKWSQVEDFDHRVRGLFHDNYPALLTDFADAFNASHRKQRERYAKQRPDPENDTRDDAQKMLDFARRTHNEPAMFVEATLDGLAAARHRVALAVNP